MPDEDKYGEPKKFDKNFKGPIHNRSCTDIICCLLFLIFFLAMLVVSVWAFIHGDPKVLLYPTDSDGNLCGSGELEDKPNLFFFDLTACALEGFNIVLEQGCSTKQICVEKCPDKNWGFVPLTSKTTDMICDYKYELEQASIADLSKAVYEDERCAAYYVKSTAILGRCFPDFLGIGDFFKDNNLTNAHNEIITEDQLEGGASGLGVLLDLAGYGVKIYQDVQATWWMIIIGLVLAMILSFIWIVLMRWIAWPMVWLTIILFILLFGFGAGYSFYRYYTMKDDPAHDIEGDIRITTELSYYTNLSKTWLALGIIAAVFWLIIVILVLFLRERILIAISLIKQASKAVQNMLSTLFWPLIPFLLQLVLFVYWGLTAIFLASTGEKQLCRINNNGTCLADYALQEQGQELLESIDCNATDKLCNFLKYGGDEYTIYLQVFMLFMLFWVMNFIIALGQIVLAGAFASYFWTFDKSKDLPTFPVMGSLGRALRYHLGSIAFGSLIIAIIQMIRVFLEYLDQKLKGTQNSFAKFIMKCLKCCFWCLEKVIRFINKNAYIMIAIHGKNFCASAKDAFFLLLRNIVRVAVVDKVTDLIVFIGKLMIVGAVGVSSFFFFSGVLHDKIPVQSISDYVQNYTPQLNYYLVPVIIIGVGSYVIASGFFNVYSMGVDTLFLCFLEDLERNDGSADKPYFMTKGLREILGKKNAPEAEASRSD